MSAEAAEQFAGSDLVLEQPNCRLFVGDRELGAGTLTITECDLSWISDGSDKSLRLEYPDICVHAISRDTSAFPSPCVYVLSSPAESTSSEEEESDVEEEPPMEVRIVPPNADLYCKSTYAVETIYSAICECQLLYPDPEQSDSSEEDSVQEIQESSGDFFTSADGLQHLTAEGEIVLAHLESVLHVDDASASQNGTDVNSFTGQFDDAEENTTT